MPPKLPSPIGVSVPLLLGPRFAKDGQHQRAEADQAAAEIEMAGRDEPRRVTEDARPERGQRPQCRGGDRRAHHLRAACQVLKVYKVYKVYSPS
jgi:hypothetical protein